MRHELDTNRTPSGHDLVRGVPARRRRPVAEGGGGLRGSPGRLVTDLGLAGHVLLPIHLNRSEQTEAGFPYQERMGSFKRAYRGLGRAFCRIRGRFGVKSHATSACGGGGEAGEGLVLVGGGLAVLDAFGIEHVPSGTASGGLVRGA